MEIKRYSLVEYIGYKTKTLDSIEEYNSLIKEFKKNNSSEKSKNYYGNLTYREENGKYIVFYDEYRRITLPARLEALYYVTTRFEDINGFKDYCNAKSNDICIAYFETKSKKEQRFQTNDVGIKELSLLFSEDKEYLNDTYLCNIVHEMASKKEYYFFNRMCERFECIPNVKDEISRVYEAMNEVERGITTVNLEVRGIQLLKKIIRYRDDSGKLVLNEDGTYKNNYRKLVDMAIFIKNTYEDINAYREKYSNNRSL